MNLGTTHKAISERVVAALLATLLLALISLTVHALEDKEKSPYRRRIGWIFRFEVAIETIRSRHHPPQRP